jgi:hypothetical protein
MDHCITENVGILLSVNYIQGTQQKYLVINVLSLIHYMFRPYSWIILK